jgi:hypothetical protein
VWGVPGAESTRVPALILPSRVEESRRDDGGPYARQIASSTIKQNEKMRDSDMVTRADQRG